MSPPPAANKCLKQGILPCTAGDTIKMNIVTPWALKPTTPHQYSNFPIHGFVEKYHNGLHHAAYLLAGSEGAHLVEMISDALSEEMVLSRRTFGLLSALGDILFLKHVDDPGKAQSGYFVAIDPADPVIEELCLLADGFAEALRICSEASPQGSCATNVNGVHGCQYHAGAQKMGELQ
jgi:hypothetical protein|tara:strand:+ start:967 stop:1500 length:534 start_codon:yes stop_codon:yes gene_type:complete